MTMWPPQKNDLPRPVYRSLAQAVLRAIEAGELTKGDRLPPHRELSYQLGISVQTVSRAYEELIRLGVINGEVGRGTYISENQVDNKTPNFYLPADQRKQLIDLSVLKPVCAQVQIDAMRTALFELGGNLPADVVFSFRPATARHSYLIQAKKWLSLCDLDAPLDSILLTNGSTASMTVALMTVARTGDRIIAEDFCHHTLKPLATYLGMKLDGCMTDDEGIIPKELDRLCEIKRPKALYVMPNGLNPRARIMGPSRRRQLANLAKKHDFYIIENDAWGPIQPEVHPPIYTFATDRVLYFTGFTKCLMPGLRAGYLVVPEQLKTAAANRHLVSSWMATSISIEIVTRWIENGTAKELLEWQKAALKQRNKIASDAFVGLSYLSSPHGMHIWLPITEDWTEDAFVTQLRKNGVATGAGSAFAVETGRVANAVRICLGPTSEADLAKGLSIIRQQLASQPILESLNL